VVKVPGSEKQNRYNAEWKRNNGTEGSPKPSLTPKEAVSEQPGQRSC
jgi:hypothetical protein